MSSVSAQFDCQCKITPEASAHSTRDDVDDVKRVIDVVKREKLWLVQDWMQKKITNYKQYNQLQEGNLSGTEPALTLVRLTQNHYRYCIHHNTYRES